jgi:predicted S18 family serine protease
MALPAPSPMVQDVLQKLNSIGADFVWIFAVYQEQMRINKSLKDDITNVSASHELLRQAYDLAEREIASLKSQLYNSGDDASDGYTEFSSESSAEERVKDQQEEISYLKAENRRIQLEHEAEMSGMAEATRRYEETLARASEMVSTSAKRIAELEARRESEVIDQSCDSVKQESEEA